MQDDGVYGRRLIHEAQLGLLKKYDIVLFGAFDRNDLSTYYPIGFIYTDKILSVLTKDSATFDRPDGGRYPNRSLPVKTSHLLSISWLMAAPPHAGRL